MVIIAGTVFVAAVIFGTGVYLSNGGWHGRHHHGPCMMHHGPPMGPGFGEGPEWPGFRTPGPGNGPGGPGGPPPPPPTPPTAPPHR
ncbi:hypothetical protein AWC18_07545 [Mycolicibacter nonchromogenicus]|uniref:Proline rich protein n=1 Tax=Mycolicibacter nonchromogenicus TaxID=1782 RepID=A0A1X1ZGJ7_MYCNO|nr:hypothetical protein AWC18_07545 [Mycolicibacter nonchromogenicus]